MQHGVCTAYVQPVLFCGGGGLLCGCFCCSLVLLIIIFVIGIVVL